MFIVDSRESVYAAPLFHCPSDGTHKRTALQLDGGSVKTPTVGRDFSSCPELAKFLPVRLPVPRMMPIISHNYIDRSEWLRAQLVLDFDRRRSERSDVSVSARRLWRARSDPSLCGFETAGVAGDSDCFKDTNESDDESNDIIDWTAISPEVNAICRASRSCDVGATPSRWHRWQRPSRGCALFPDVDDQRFDVTSNIEFCRVNAGFSSGRVDERTESTLMSVLVTAPALWADLYVQLPRRRSFNATMYHLKVELVFIALRSYLDPCCQVGV